MQYWILIILFSCLGMTSRHGNVSALLALCRGSTGDRWILLYGFPSQSQLFFVVSLNNLLKKHSFEFPVISDVVTLMWLYREVISAPNKDSLFIWNPFAIYKFWMSSCQWMITRIKFMALETLNANVPMWRDCNDWKSSRIILFMIFSNILTQRENNNTNNYIYIGNDISMSQCFLAAAFTWTSTWSLCRCGYIINSLLIRLYVWYLFNKSLVFHCDQYLHHTAIFVWMRIVIFSAYIRVRSDGISFLISYCIRFQY